MESGIFSTLQIFFKTFTSHLIVKRLEKMCFICTLEEYRNSIYLYHGIRRTVTQTNNHNHSSFISSVRRPRLRYYYNIKGSYNKSHKIWYTQCHLQQVFINELDISICVSVYVYDKWVSKYPETSAVSPPLELCHPEILSSQLLTHLYRNIMKGKK